jgi:hypothetical protein
LSDRIARWSEVPTKQLFYSLKLAAGKKMFGYVKNEGKEQGAGLAANIDC